MNRASTVASLMLSIIAGLISTAVGQNSTSPCTMTPVSSLSNCTTGATGLKGLGAMAFCFQSTMSCPNAKDITFYFGYLPPGGATPIGYLPPPGGATPKGVVVLLPGAGGQNANPEMESTFATDYSSSPFNYQVVQLQWYQADWEDVNQGNNSVTQNCANSCPPNVEVAAARPASFLNYIYTKYYQPIQQIRNNSSAGMCVQGFSG